ncbi:MAG: extracellular solute-binding protein [Alphaproteobacteria bacterium]|nr:extracellular solute-binding protein [Alphaproteobacteria bacterium]
MQIKDVLLSVFISFFILILFLNQYNPTNNVVNVYGWYGLLPKSILEQFEKEYGIKVRFDAYDNNDVLEAKLLSGSHGYDVVFPSFIPYASRQITMGAFGKINYKLIPNIKNTYGAITENFKKYKGNTDYVIPTLWGTIGIVYNKDTINKLFPNLKTLTYRELMSEAYMKEFSKYGVSFPEEYIDILPQIQTLIDDYSNFNPIINILAPIRKYVTKFNSATVIYDILSEESCIAICSSDYAFKIISTASKLNKNIEFSIPKGSTVLWIDCMAIPKTAPHKENAHKFINFILQPEIAAEITNYSGILVNVSDARKYVDDAIKENTNIFPDDNELIRTFILGRAIRSENDVKYDREANKVWAKIKLNKNLHSITNNV